MQDDARKTLIAIASWGEGIAKAAMTKMKYTATVVQAIIFPIRNMANTTLLAFDASELITSSLNRSSLTA